MKHLSPVAHALLRMSELCEKGREGARGPSTPSPPTRNRLYRASRAPMASATRCLSSGASGGNAAAGARHLIEAPGDPAAFPNLRSPLGPIRGRVRWAGSWGAQCRGTLSVSVRGNAQTDAGAPLFRAGTILSGTRGYTTKFRGLLN